MNITPVFSLTINDWNGTDAFPPHGTPQPLKDQLREHYSADEDTSFASIELPDLATALQVIDLYKDKGVSISLNCTVKTEGVYMVSSIELDTRHSLRSERIVGHMRLSEPAAISRKEAAEKLHAIAHSLEKEAQ